MADVKISALPVAASVALSDYVPCVVSGPTTKRATFTVVRTALLPIVLTADVSGTLPVGNGGTGFTAFGANVPTFLQTPTGANLASALTSALPVSKGGLGADASAFTGLLKFAAGTASAATLVNADVAAGAAVAVSKLAPAGTNGFVLTTTGGVPVWAASAGGTPSTGSAGQIDIADGAGGWSAATNVLGGSGFISIGSTPAASGAVRLPNASAVLVTVRNSLNSADLTIASTDGADNLNLGMDPAYTAAKQFTGVNLYGLSTVAVGIGSTTKQYVTSNSNENWQPITGSNGGASPYGAHGLVDVDMNNANLVAPASKYMFQFLNVISTAAFTANRSLTLPTPPTDAAGYIKYVRNSQAGAFSVVVGCGGGGNTAVITVGKGGFVQCDNTFGCRLITALI